MPEIWVPPSFTGGAPKFACRLCTDRFHSSESLASHIRWHWKKDEAEIRMQSAREKHPHLFGDAGVDTEFEKWHRDRGAARRD